MHQEKRFGQEVIGSRVRSTDRVQTLISAQLSSDDGLAATFVISDISADGCTGSCSEPLRVGSGATLALPGGDSINAVVKWNDGIKAGLQFDYPLTFRKLLAIKHGDQAAPAGVQAATPSARGSGALAKLFRRGK